MHAWRQFPLHNACMQGTSSPSTDGFRLPPGFCPQIQKAREEARKQASESNVNLSNVEFGSLVGRLVRYMLFASYEKPGTPVSRAKLNDLLTSDNKNHKNAKKLLTRTLPEAQVLWGW